MSRAGNYCLDPVGKCLRERFAVNGVPKIDIHICIRNSDTYAACQRGQKLDDDFSEERAQSGWLIWVENFSHNQLIPPQEVLVDWTSGVFRQVEKNHYGCVSDVLTCLYAQPNRTTLLKAPVVGRAYPVYQDIEADIEAHHSEFDQESPTTRAALDQARRGQGIFREQLIFVWDSKCAVTKCGTLPLLRASHIKPWRDSTNAERLDRFNGLLLSPNLDAAFDRGLISFSDQGRILISKAFIAADAATLGITPTLRLVCVFDENKPFLAIHRQLHGF